jgi:hypothetical protein
LRSNRDTSQVFLQAYADARKNIRGSPAVTFSQREPPLELQGEIVGVAVRLVDAERDVRQALQLVVMNKDSYRLVSPVLIVDLCQQRFCLL